MYIEILESYLKGNLSEKVISELIKNFQVVEYKKGDFFARMGRKEDKLGFVAEGLFYMYIENADGGMFTKDFMHAKNFLLAAFRPEESCEVFIQALKDSIVLEMKYSHFMEECEKSKELAVLAKKGGERRIERIYKKIEAFATMEAAKRYEGFKQEFGSIEKDIPQYIIASYLGITPTQMSRINRKLRASENQHM